MAVTIITDSTSDLSEQLVRDLNVVVVPLTVRFGDEEFVDGVTLTRAQFFEKLRAASELPKTSQIPPSKFLPLFNDAIARGDDVVCVLVGSEFSGSYQSAVTARGMCTIREQVHVIDSRHVTHGLALLVIYAAKLRDEGMNAQHIAEELNAALPRLRVYAMIDDLKYLVLGGRLPAAGAVVGRVLGIRPTICVMDNHISVTGVARNVRRAQNWMVDRLREHGHQAGVPVVLIHVEVPEHVEALRELIMPELHGDELLVGEVGSVVGTHAGPGCFGLAFLALR